jgi:hypothetical protein
MKTLLLAILSFFVLTHLSAQNIEVSVQANSGIFHYSGNSAVSTSAIYQGSTPQQNYTNNPYGSKNGFSYGGDIQAQYVSKSGFIAGLQAGYEVLRSKVVIDSYYPITFYFFYGPNSPIPYQIPAKGQTFLQDQDIGINPYIGYRLIFAKIKLDMMPGIDLGFDMNSYDKGKATDNGGNVYRTDLKLPDAPTDVRLKLGAAATYKRFGLTAAYLHGLTNLYKNMTVNGSDDARSELISFGITYRISPL